jgi:uncharacterized protein YdhG (YjbR/CyaY superfamily)
MTTHSPTPVDTYLAGLPPDARQALADLRKAIKAAAPKADEVLSYKVPTYKQNGVLVHFAYFAKHLGFYVVDKSLMATFADELKPWKTSGTTVHFSPDHPLPAALVKKIVKARVKQNG